MISKSSWQIALFCAVTLLSAQTVSGQATTTLTPAQLEKAVALDLQAGNWPRADALAQALLIRDPNDVAAQLMRSRALTGMARFDEAQEFARKAWGNASTDTEKYNSALLLAQALSSDGKRTRAQLWLRRAVEHAPSDGHAARAKQDFRYVRQRNPWQTYLSFTLAPQSNINNGSDRDTYVSDTIFDRLVSGGPQLQTINPEAQALSGLEIGFSAQSRYRFAQSERRAHDLRLGLSYRSYILSNESKSDAPDASGSDYAFGIASIGYGFRQLRADGRGELGLGVEMGQLFFAGARYSSYVRANATQSYYLSRKTKLRFGVVVEQETGQRVSDSESLGANIGVDRALSNGDGLHIGLTLLGQQSPNELHEYNDAQLRAGYIIGREIKGAIIQFGIGARIRDYDAHLLSFDGRRDTEISADVSATFRQIDYYGFNPRVTLKASKQDSNIDVYDSTRIGLSIGIVSAF